MDLSCMDRIPRCFEHGCGGRAFANFENYRRHVREKQGQDLALCIFCGSSFIRRSNRDAHLTLGRCSALKQINDGSTVLNGNHSPDRQEHIEDAVIVDMGEYQKKERDLGECAKTDC